MINRPSLISLDWKRLQNFIAKEIIEKIKSVKNFKSNDCRNAKRWLQRFINQP